MCFSGPNVNLVLGSRGERQQAEGYWDVRRTAGRAGLFSVADRSSLMAAQPVSTVLSVPSQRGRFRRQSVSVSACPIVLGCGLGGEGGSCPDTARTQAPHGQEAHPPPPCRGGQGTLQP